MLGFSYILSWVFKKYKNQTISTLTGFILGSLGIIWPWKNAIIENFGDKNKVVGYTYFFPPFDLNFFIALFFIVIGYITIWLMEKNASKK